MSEPFDSTDAAAAGVPPTPFRAAFTRARDAAREGVDALSEPAAPLQTAAPAIASASARPASFEVRIVRRRGVKRDEKRWTRLGHKGWELVAVDRRHAFFRRERRSAS